jgi:hypothetical protein
MMEDPDEPVILPSGQVLNRRGRCVHWRQKMVDGRFVCFDCGRDRGPITGIVVNARGHAPRRAEAERN